LAKIFPKTWSRYDAYNGADDSDVEQNPDRDVILCEDSKDVGEKSLGQPQSHH